MTIEHYIIAKLAECMWTVANDSPERQAIGCMLRNRVAANGLSWWKELDGFSEAAPANPHDPDFIRTLWDAEEIYYNRMPDRVDGSTSVTQRPCINSVRIGRFYFKVESQVSCDLPVQIDSPHDLEV